MNQIQETLPVLFLFHAYDNTRGSLIMDDTKIPEGSEVDIIILNTSEKTVFAYMGLREPKRNQGYVKKLKPHQKKTFTFTIHKKCTLNEFQCKVVEEAFKKLSDEYAAPNKASKKGKEAIQNLIRKISFSVE